MTKNQVCNSWWWTYVTQLNILSCQITVRKNIRCTIYHCFCIIVLVISTRIYHVSNILISTNNTITWTELNSQIHVCIRSKVECWIWFYYLIICSICKVSINTEQCKRVMIFTAVISWIHISKTVIQPPRSMCSTWSLAFEQIVTILYIYTSVTFIVFLREVNITDCCRFNIFELRIHVIYTLRPSRWLWIIEIV